MQYYSYEMILVGIILFSGITAGGIKIWLKRRQNALENLDLKYDLNSNKIPDNLDND